jgi:hypothetical protein
METLSAFTKRPVDPVNFVNNGSDDAVPGTKPVLWLCVPHFHVVCRCRDKKGQWWGVGPEKI